MVWSVRRFFAGEATRLAYGTDEAAEGRLAFLENVKGDFSRLLHGVLTGTRTR